ncbi:alpha-1,2-mannosidase [Capsulimonas corticalis]|uniref:Alpha-1,2-mannosidase n=1 Tax=Capsulimonas corticalis TaxID=2219043 RepID=A0A402CQP3_9BACT|nr:GH92 family glycosyl hydrolase [Capsulimonas corticalis]BDI32634.1 alpha-1,2-mannosidase [Capsulimonas corticalis]
MRQYHLFPLSALIAGASLGISLPLHAYTLQNLTPYVLPFCGTQNGGNTFPGAVTPFGMMQWSPDTPSGIQGGSEPGGYLYTDNKICGFSFNHVSGGGGFYGSDLGFTPIVGNLTSSPVTSSSPTGYLTYASTIAGVPFVGPGYYSVQLTNGIETELTASTRTGFGRFTYPSGNAATMLINAGSGASIIDASIQINPGGNEVSGWTTGFGFLGSGQNHRLYFDVVFDHSFSAYGTWNGSSLSGNSTSVSGSKSGAYLTFNGGGTVLARSAVSWVSVANAKANLNTESPASTFNNSGFDAMHSAANNTWNGYLNKIQVSGGTSADTQTFYSALYHSLLAPSVVSDVNNQYMGFDGQVRTTSGFTKYEYFSGWDIYRNECQLIAMIDPARASDMAQSLVQDASDCGAMPRWSIPTGDTGTMIGDPATPIIAGMYAFGARNFNTGAAKTAMAKAATDPSTKSSNGVYERDAERDYLNLGYVPEYQIGGYAPISMTLEYCSADAALARFAQFLGDSATYNSAMSRAQNWRNLFNSGSGYFQMRQSDRWWSPGFASNVSTYDNYNAFAEGTGAQYVWMVPFNYSALIGAMGGASNAASRLDNFFTQINDTNTSVTQYAYMGNEPCSETPYVYDYLGQPYKCSNVVRRVMTQLYSSASTGLPGNDDLGQTSSWYVWAALGFHPEAPGDDVLVMNGPLFPQTVIHLAGGDVTINGGGAADNAPYIQSLTVNGQTSNSPWTRFANISNGATLNYTMGTNANTSWGASSSFAPPSNTDGMSTPVTQNYFWGTSLEAGEYQPTWTNSVDTNSPGGNISNVGPILSGGSGPELGIRNENSQSGSSELMYSGGALGGSAVYAYLKAFDVSSKSIVVTSGMHLSYWLYPQSSATSGLVSGNNSAHVAVDLVFTDNSTLRDSGLNDQRGVRLHPNAQSGSLALDTWNYVSVDLTPLAGKAVNRIDFGYDNPNSTGGYRGYIDDIAFTTTH